MTDQQLKELRNALGSFATGVTVVTAQDKQGQPVGMTVNSFASVSLDPPLLLWSLGESSYCYDIFRDAEHFAINILSAEQQSHSQLFASSEAEKFSRIEWQLSENNLPLLANCVAHLECQTEHRYPGGDHIILVGRVLSFDYCNNSPLIFSQSKYRTLI